MSLALLTERATMRVSAYAWNDTAAPERAGADTLLKGASIEVIPRTATKVKDFRSLLMEGTRVYIAHIDGTPIGEMVATAKRIRAEGFAVMPHLPARSIANMGMLREWVSRYRDVGVDEMLVLAGGRSRPVGELSSSVEILESGVLEGYSRIHVAGHPEGNHDVDPDGGTKCLDEALMWKQAFADHSSAEVAIVTQFLFDAAPLISWVQRIRRMGVTLPVHVGVSGPATLGSLIRYARACGVGPSLSVLTKRAKDVAKLLVPLRADDIVASLAKWVSESPEAGIAQMHVYPLGGIEPAASWIASTTGESG